MSNVALDIILAAQPICWSASSSVYHSDTVTRAGPYYQEGDYALARKSYDAYDTRVCSVRIVSVVKGLGQHATYGYLVAELRQDSNQWLALSTELRPLNK